MLQVLNGKSLADSMGPYRCIKTVVIALRPNRLDLHHMMPLCMQASLPQTVAAMRFILAYQNCTTGQAGGPLTEEEFLARLHDWATTEPTLSGSAPRSLLFTVRV